MNIVALQDTLPISNFTFSNYGCAIILEALKDRTNKDLKFIKVDENFVCVILLKFVTFLAAWLAWIWS